MALLITQVFAFYYDQLSAMTGVVFLLVLYACLSYVISQEEAQERTVAIAPLEHPALAPEPT